MIPTSAEKEQAHLEDPPLTTLLRAEYRHTSPIQHTAMVLGFFRVYGCSIRSACQWGRYFLHISHLLRARHFRAQQ